MNARLKELVNRVVSRIGPIARTLSANEWHELRDELEAWREARTMPPPPAAHNDSVRLNWLSQDADRLEDVRGRMNNEGSTAREAIDFFMGMTEVKRIVDGAVR